MVHWEQALWRVTAGVLPRPPEQDGVGRGFDREDGVRKHFDGGAGGATADGAHPAAAPGGGASGREIGEVEA